MKYLILLLLPPPVSVIYDTEDDDHNTSHLYEAFKGIPPRAIPPDNSVRNGDYRHD